MLGFLSAQDNNQSKTFFFQVFKRTLFFFPFLFLKYKYPDEHSVDVISVLCELGRKLYFKRSRKNWKFKTINRDQWDSVHTSPSYWAISCVTNVKGKVYKMICLTRIQVGGKKRLHFYKCFLKFKIFLLFLVHNEYSLCWFTELSCRYGKFWGITTTKKYRNTVSNNLSLREKWKSAG